MIEQRGIVHSNAEVIQVGSPPTSTLQPGPRPERFPLVWPSERNLSGERFPDDDAVEEAVCAWFRQQPKVFYAAVFKGLVKRWDKCLNLYGDYVET
jgi:hypothetical protein